MIAVKITSNVNNVSKAFKKIELGVPKEMDAMTFEYAKQAQRYLRAQLTINKTTTKQNITWNSIRATKLSNKTSVVRIRKEGIYLDRMKPHYVSLNVQGTKVKSWVKEKFGNKRRTGLSRVYYGIQGNIEGGALYVTPHPFIDTALARTRRIMRSRLIKKFKETVAGV